MNFGEPQKIRFNRIGTGLTIEQYPVQPLRWVFAKDFAIGDALKTDAARKLYTTKLAEVGGNPENVTVETYTQIADLDALPQDIPMPPGVQAALEKARFGSRLQELCFDQTFVDTTTFLMSNIRSKNVPLLEGPPGSCKTQASVFCSAVLKRPLYAITGVDGATEQIKRELQGGPVLVAEPYKTAKELTFDGALQRAKARRHFVDLAAIKPFSAFSDADFTKIAELEGIEPKSYYQKMGLYDLAARYGGILLLDEINGFPPDVSTMLTGIMENYTKSDIHPNFAIICTQNPAGIEHPNRKPLAKELGNRAVKMRVLPPTYQQIAEQLHYKFSAIQPTIQYNGKPQKMSTADFGIQIAAPKPSNLRQILTPQDLSTIITGIAKLHIAIATHVAEGGVLDPQASQSDQVDEKASISRRDLTRFIRALESNLVDAAELNASLASDGSVNESNTAVSVVSDAKLDLARVTSSQFTQAFTQALQMVYVTPHTFSTRLSIDTGDAKASRNTPVTSTAKLLDKLIAESKLNPEQLAGLETMYELAQRTQALSGDRKYFFQKMKIDLDKLPPGHQSILPKLNKGVPMTGDENKRLVFVPSTPTVLQENFTAVLNNKGFTAPEAKVGNKKLSVISWSEAKEVNYGDVLRANPLFTKLVEGCPVLLTLHSKDLVGVIAVHRSQCDPTIEAPYKNDVAFIPISPTQAKGSILAFTPLLKEPKKFAVIPIFGLAPEAYTINNDSRSI